MGKGNGLALSVKLGDVLQIGDTKIELVYKSGTMARLRIHAPDEIKVRLIKSEHVSEPTGHELWEKV